VANIFAGYDASPDDGAVAAAAGGAVVSTPLITV
jgi:hypothetical protein